MEAMMEKPPSTSGINHRIRSGTGYQQATQQHGGNDGDRIGFKQVGRHTGAVADVVTDVVSDYRRVARVVLGNAGFDLTHQVGTYVSAFGENAAAKTSENGDQRTAESQSHQCMRCLLGTATHHHGEESVIARHAEQAQAHDQHAGNRAAFEGYIQCCVQAFFGRFSSAHISAHRYIHADIAGQS
jgi:hypothetical protein